MNAGEIPVRRGRDRWRMSSDESEPTEEEFELAANALAYFLRGALLPIRDSSVLSVQFDNYGERTIAVYVLAPGAFTEDFITLCQSWLRMPEFVGWRILLKCAWKNPVDVTIYADLIFLNRRRVVREEAVRLMSLQRKNA